MQANTRLLDFLRTRTGIAFVALGVVLLAIGFAPSCNSNRKGSRPRNQPAVMSSASSNAHITISRPQVPVAPAPIKIDTSSRTNRRPIIYSVHVDLPAEANSVVASNVAPFGRLLQVQLVNTLESLMPNTPIIGLVTEDLWYNGRLIIPAGTEVHGKAQLDRVRERVVSTGPWMIVFQNGEQMSATGIALDREFDVDGSGWGIRDGSGGIAGDILRSGTMDEVKLFLATALSGVASGLQQTRTTAFGAYVPGNLPNAGLNGASQVLNTYAQRILEAIRRDGIYVRVPAGKQFYVYLTESFDTTKARIAGAKAHSTESNATVATHRTEASPPSSATQQHANANVP